MWEDAGGSRQLRPETIGEFMFARSNADGKIVSILIIVQLVFLST